MKQEHISLRCEDGQEAVVFTKYTYKYDGSIDYEITVEDSYTGGDYNGFFGRIKRAWKAFWDKPVVYTGIYCEDEDKMRKFLCDCLDLIDDNDVKDILECYKDSGGNEPFLKGLYNEDGSVTTNEELIKKGEW